jgi:low affinity Fe/Cu permease
MSQWANQLGVSDRRTGVHTSVTFGTLARTVSEVLGTSWIFAVACASVVIWLISGPFFHFSDAWQLVINTTTTIITFLMVFLIQNTQNREARATQLKLDELIRSIGAARNKLIDLENCTDQELEDIHQEFQKFRQQRSGHSKSTT